MANLPITNVVNISVATSQSGVNAYNTSNLALFTDEVPLGATQTLTFSGVAASGVFKLAFNGNLTANINYNDAIAVIQGKINAVTGQSQIVASGSIASQSLVLTQPGILGAIPVSVVSANTMQTAGSVAVTVAVATTSAGWSGGSLGYSLYLSPTQVGVDFGTSSKTYQMANAIFAQQPNILAGGGQLVVIPFAICQQTLTFSAAPTSGSFAVTYNSNTSALINATDSPSAVQTKLQAVPGLSQVVVTGYIGGALLTVYMYGVYGASVLSLGTTTNTLNASITVTGATSVVGESYSTAITRTQGLVSYFGAMVNETLAVIGQTDLLASAATVQALNMVSFVVSYLQADIAPGGMLDLLRSGGDTQTRGLYYGDSSVVGGFTGLNALLMMAAYAGRGLSTNFNGSNTTQTLHLKGLSTINPDPTMTQTILAVALAAGADTYVSLQGVSKVFCSGLNNYYDQVYNLGWFVGALQVAGFNYLAQSSTKVPQTEPGMDGLKSAYRAVCEQAVTNQYLAPGTWTSSTTFGVQQDFINNISQRGYYIFSSPIALQAATARAARQAPLVQIAAKQAGAIQSSSVIVNINA